MKPKLRAPLPHAFVLEELAEIDPIVRPMFGCRAIYREDKILVVLRHREDHLRDNGVWIAVPEEHREDLRREFPSMRPVFLLANGKETAWQNLPEDAPDFEESALRACELIRRRDPRIGKVPKAKRKPLAPKRSARKRAP